MKRKLSLWIVSILANSLMNNTYLHCQMVNGVYKFDLLKVGELEGQDGWIATALYSKEGHLNVVQTNRDSGSKAITGTPGKTRYYFRKFRPEDKLPPFKNDDRTLVIQFDIMSGPHSGTFFVGGEQTGVAIIWDEVIKVRSNGITGKMPLLTTATPPDIPSGTWVTLRLEISNKNASLLWKACEEEDADFVPFAEADDFEVGELLESAHTWDRMGVAIGRAGTMQINNLVPNAIVLNNANETPLQDE